MTTIELLEKLEPIAERLGLRITKTGASEVWDIVANTDKWTRTYTIYSNSADLLNASAIVLLLDALEFAGYVVSVSTRLRGTFDNCETGYDCNASRYLGTEIEQHSVWGPTRLTAVLACALSVAVSLEEAIMQITPGSSHIQTGPCGKLGGRW
jgi:hypothetical protein